MFYPINGGRLLNVIGPLAPAIAVALFFAVANSAMAQTAPPAALRGSYAPGGDCTKEPRFTLTDVLTVQAAGKSTRFGPVDSCTSCVAGPDYSGIEVWVSQLGADGMPREPTLRFNADEKRGVVVIDKAGSQAFAPPMRALAMASPLKRCAK